MVVKSGIVLVGVAAVAVLMAACAGEGEGAGTERADVRRGGASEVTPAEALAAAAPPRVTIHNLVDVIPGLTSGTMPEGEGDFAELAQRGFATIISVDGATPDVETAAKHGLRYVHLPIGYHGMEKARQLELARAVRDLPGPIYLHCHHGKHRGPAAAVTAAVLLDELTPEEAVAVMKKAGTSPHYKGLYACAERAAPVSMGVIDSADGSFPAVAPMPGFISAMAETQLIYERLKEIEAAGWTVPAHHPDLVPVAEAGRMENLVRAMLDDPETRKHPEDFAAMMVASLEAAQAMEDALAAQAPRDELSARLKALDVSCKDCHLAYRDNRPMGE